MPSRASLARKENDASPLVVSAGGRVRIVTVGASVSTGTVVVVGTVVVGAVVVGAESSSAAS